MVSLAAQVLLYCHHRCRRSRNYSPSFKGELSRGIRFDRVFVYRNGGASSKAKFFSEMLIGVAIDEAHCIRQWRANFSF